VREHQTHLQQDLETLGDLVGLAVLEALRAIASLQQEALAALRRCKLFAQALDFPGDHDRRQTGQLGHRVCECHRIAIHRLLLGGSRLPTRRIPGLVLGRLHAVLTDRYAGN
jgi:hypothetical protein